jgi:outer membrane protein OmpA-like peptidoglycan-associated protein
MKINLISGLRTASFIGLTLIWTSCGGNRTTESNTEEEVSELTEGMEEEDHSGHDHSGHDHSEASHEGGDDMEMMDSKGTDLGFAEGSWAWSLQDFMDNGSGTKTFILDKIPFEGEEISVEGNQQLDDLAALLKAHPDMMAEVQAHTPAADNAIGRTAKKTASTARAAWVQLKLKTRGVDGKQLSSKGYADEMLLENLDPKDEAQKRLAIVINK